MGYMTDYKLSTIPEDAYNDVRTAIERQSGYDPFLESCKWYQHESDIQAVSLGMPAVIITVHGEGEDAGDQRVIHACDGRIVVTKRNRWEPPPPPRDMIEEREVNAEAAQRKIEREQEEREREEYERLRAKFGAEDQEPKP